MAKCVHEEINGGINDSDNALVLATFVVGLDQSKPSHDSRRNARVYRSASQHLQSQGHQQRQRAKPRPMGLMGQYTSYGGGSHSVL